MNKLMQLSFQQLAILKELRSHTSLRSLCIKLAINVSNISREITALEDILKVKIVTTSSKGFIMTAEGLRVSQIADDLLIHAEKLNQFTSFESDEKVLHTVGSRGYLNLLATTKFSAGSEVSDLVRLRFLDLAPNETLQLAVMGVLDSIVHFEKYELPSSWMTQPLLENIPWKLYVRKNHPLADKQNLHISDVLKYPFVMSTSWNGREVTINDDGFPFSWSERRKGFEAQTALMALHIVSNTDQVVFLPEIFEDIFFTNKITTLEPKDLVSMHKTLYISVHTTRVSLKLFRLFLAKFKEGDSNEKDFFDPIGDHQFI
jgi:DNA-binding transcriptional LysR family regulator